MPIVPRVQRTVSPTALPGVRKSAAETELSTGAGLEEARARKFAALGQLGGTLEQTGHAIGEIAIEERDKADQIQATANDNQLNAWLSKRLYDPETGALTVTGKDSFGLPEQVLGEFDQVAGDIESKLGNDRQKQIFERQRLRSKANLDMTLRRHVFEQMQAYDAQETQAAIENNVNFAVANANDPRMVGQNLDTAIQAATSFAKRHHIGPEQLTSQVEAITSKTHVGVIENLLEQGNTKAASVYFDETKGAIKGESLARVEKALSEGKTRKTAQEQADQIIAAGGTLTQQREKARSIEDPDVRDSVMARLEHEDAVQEKARRDAEEQNLKGVYDIVDKTHDVANIPPATWANLEGSQRSALQSYANNLARGVQTETDLPTYYSLMRQAADSPDTFATSNLLTYRAKLGDTEFKQLANLQLSIRSGKKEATDKQLTGFRTASQIVDDSLTSYGIDPNTKDAKQQQAIAQLRRSLDSQIEVQESTTGKKPTNDDIQRYTDKLLSLNQTTPGSWWGLIPFNGVSLSQQQKRLIDLEPGDVPAEDRSQIESALRAKGRPVTDATVLDLYIRTKARLGQ